MNVFTLTIGLLLFVLLSECTLSPPKDRNSKKGKGKIEIKVRNHIQKKFLQILYLYLTFLYIGIVEGARWPRCIREGFSGEKSKGSRYYPRVRILFF